MATSLVRSLVALLLALGLAGLAAAAADSDPPARVGRASLVEGDVAYLRDGAVSRDRCAIVCVDRRTSAGPRGWDTIGVDRRRRPHGAASPHPACAGFEGLCDAPFTRHARSAAVLAALSGCAGIDGRCERRCARADRSARDQGRAELSRPDRAPARQPRDRRAEGRVPSRRRGRRGAAHRSARAPGAHCLRPRRRSREARRREALCRARRGVRRRAPGVGERTGHDRPGDRRRRRRHARHGARAGGRLRDRVPVRRRARDDRLHAAGDAARRRNPDVRDAPGAGGIGRALRGRRRSDHVVLEQGTARDARRQGQHLSRSAFKWTRPRRRSGRGATNRAGGSTSTTSG